MCPFARYLVLLVSAGTRCHQSWISCPYSDSGRGPK